MTPTGLVAQSVSVEEPPPLHTMRPLQVPSLSKERVAFVEAHRIPLRVNEPVQVILGSATVPGVAVTSACPSSWS
jgi:hypothetical protein